MTPAEIRAIAVNACRANHQLRYGQAVWNALAALSSPAAQAWVASTRGGCFDCYYAGDAERTIAIAVEDGVLEEG